MPMTMLDHGIYQRQVHEARLTMNVPPTPLQEYRAGKIEAILSILLLCACRVLLQTCKRYSVLIAQEI